MDEEYTRPFLCPVEAEPLKFAAPRECLEYLEENNIEGSVFYKVI